MGYLNNTTVTVDAILTLKGRELLAAGDGSFNVTQFALGDDEIDYDLWNPNHPLGTDYYGVIIENMPITEAVPDETQALKYRLLTLPNNTTTSIPVVTVSGDSSILDTLQQMTVTANTLPGGGNAVYGYTAILSDSSIANIQAAPGSVLAGSNPTVPLSVANGEATSVAVTSKGSFLITAKSLAVNKTATVTVIGNETGGSSTISFTVNKEVV
jgi:hypothetical protein